MLKKKAQAFNDTEKSDYQHETSASASSLPHSAVPTCMIVGKSTPDFQADSCHFTVTMAGVQSATLRRMVSNIRISHELVMSGINRYLQSPCLVRTLTNEREQDLLAVENSATV